MSWRLRAAAAHTRRLVLVACVIPVVHDVGVFFGDSGGRWKGVTSVGRKFLSSVVGVAGG